MTTVTHLFPNPDGASEHSESFTLRSQVTIYAFGLGAGDRVTFEALSVPAPEFACACPPGRATLPGVTGIIQLHCCGEPIELSEANPYVILDAPQNVQIRAKLESDNPEFVTVWMVNTDTKNPAPWQQGCPCEREQ